MIRVLTSTQADLDTELIAAWYAQHSEAAAEKFLSELLHLYGLISRAPEMGRSRDELELTSIRSVPLRTYLVFYTVRPEGVRVLRVLNGAQDLDNTPIAEHPATEIGQTSPFPNADA